MAVLTRWKVINSQGDINIAYFSTLADAKSWVSINGLLGHEYHYIEFSVIT